MTDETAKKEQLCLDGKPAKSRATACGGLFKRKQVWVPTARGWLLGLLAAAGAGAAVFFGARPFLAVSRPVKADVLVVEGWIAEYGLAEAGHEYVDGHYRLVVVTGGPPSVEADLIYDRSYARLAAQELKRQLGGSARVQAVPAKSIGRDRTYTSALALKDWLRANEPGVNAVNVLTVGFHARRTRLLVEKALGPDYRVGIIAVRDREYDPEHWWRYSEGVKEIISESAAYIYARFFFHPSD